MRSRRLLARLAAAVVAAAVVSTAFGGGHAAAGSPRVLRVVAASYGLEVGPQNVDVSTYTAQVHNLGQYGVLVTIGPLMRVYVPPNAWRFRTVTFTRAGHYLVRAVDHRFGPWSAALTAQ